MQDNSTQKKSGTTILLIVLLIGSLGFNFYQWKDKSDIVGSYETKTDSLSTAKVEVEKELSSTYEELNKYKGINSKLDSLLAEANIKIDEQKGRISSLTKQEKNAAALNKKLMAELEDIKKMRDEYLNRIDSLLVENNQLKMANSDLSGTVDSLTKNLQSTVSTASVLRAEYVKATSYKRKGNNKFTTTALAKRTNKIEVCFSLLENKIAKPGDKTVYLRITEPDGKVMGDRSEGSGSFKKGNGEEVMYSNKQNISYTNAKQDMCINYEEQERIFTAGKYTIEIYVDGNLSGESFIELR